MVNGVIEMSDDIVSKMGFSDEFRNMYFVDDLNVDTCKVLFILESPHTDEILAKYPVAGNSGKAMTKKFIDCSVLNRKYKDTPFGNIAKCHEKDFGILNVCQISLQPSAYCCKNLEQMMSDEHMLKLYSCFVLRNKEKCLDSKSCGDVVCIDTKNIILSDFEQRLKKVSKKAHVFTCGKFADTFFESLTKKEAQKYTNRHNSVPHPSFGNWSRARYEEKVKEMITIINDIVTGALV